MQFVVIFHFRSIGAGCSVLGVFCVSGATSEANKGRSVFCCSAAACISPDQAFLARVQALRLRGDVYVTPSQSSRLLLLLFVHLFIRLVSAFHLLSTHTYQFEESFHTNAPKHIYYSSFLLTINLLFSFPFLSSPEIYTHFFIIIFPWSSSAFSCHDADADNTHFNFCLFFFRDIPPEFLHLFLSAIPSPGRPMHRWRE